MNKFKASDGLGIAYALDDYTDPWRPADTVILVHAAMGSSIRFYAWVPQLARDFRVARIDMRGHGATPLPGPDQLSVARLARDVAEGQPLKWSDVAFDAAADAVKVRREMEAMFARPNTR